MYKLFVYDWFTGTRLDWLVRASNIDYTVKLDDVGNMTFYMDLQDEQANSENLKAYNVVRLYRYFEESGNWQCVYAGFIQNSVIVGKQVRVSVPSMMGFFVKRSTAAVYNVNGLNAGTAIHNLLTYTNGQGYTPVTIGDNDCTDTLPNLEFKRDKVTSSWLDMINQTDFDVWIDPETLELNVGVRGADKSDVVGFNYIYTLPETTNLEEYSITKEIDLLTTRVIGKSSSLEVVKETTLDGYPLLEEVRSFPEAKDVSSLGDAAQKYLNEHDQILEVPRITPAREREIFDSYWVGDLVTIRLEERGLTLNKTQRIVAITVQIGDNNNENIRIETSDGVEGRKDILDIMAEQARRLQILENNQS